MKKPTLQNILFGSLLFFSTALFAQQPPPFWDEIQNFKKQDSLRPPPKGAILFVGSSSFRMWENIEQYFPSHTIINRGFGGSSIPDVTRYASDVIFPYRPKQIIIYCGENDIAGSDAVNGDSVFNRFRTLFRLIRKKMPAVPIAFVSMKPSPSRWHLRQKMIRGNALIRNFLRQQKNTAYINVWPAMLNKKGLPDEKIFKEDKLHMNERGYRIWQKIIAPYLVRQKSKLKFHS